jgi:SAM-dependent methyltransferase
LRLFGPRTGYKYFSCDACHSIQLFPMPDEATLQAAYRSEYAEGGQLERYVDPEWARAAVRPYAAGVLGALQDHRVSGTVVDVGAGWGELIEMMLAAGLDARGVELSERQVDYARQHGWPVVRGDLSALGDLDGTASAVTLCAVFEHLTDHAHVLNDARRLLRDDGLLVTLHPTATFFHLVGAVSRLGDRARELPSFSGAFAPPWHTVLPSIEATRMILANNGFTVVDVRRAPQGRFGGITGFLQAVLNLVNDVGWPLFGTRWPLVTSHIFVCRKSEAMNG